MSALLTPFMTREAGNRADEERWFGIESFEIAVKHWKAMSNQVPSLFRRMATFTDGLYRLEWRGACGAAKRL